MSSPVKRLNPFRSVSIRLELLCKPVGQAAPCPLIPFSISRLAVVPTHSPLVKTIIGSAKTPSLFDFEFTRFAILYPIT